MPKNVVQRLQKIENDLKTVISIYEISNKCKNIHRKSEAQDEDAPQLPRITTQEVLDSAVFSNGVRETQTTQFDFPNNAATIIIQPSQDVYSNESLQSIKNWKSRKPKSKSMSFSTICEISYVKTKQTEDHRSSEEQDLVPNTDVINNNFLNTTLTSHSKKLKEEKENQNARSRFVSLRKSSILEEHPNYLIQATSNWLGSIKNCYSVNNDKYSLGVSLIPTATPKNVSRLQSSEEKNTIDTRSRTKNSQNKMKENEKDYSDTNGEREIKSIQSRKIQSTVRRKNYEFRKKNENVPAKLPSQASGAYYNQQKTRKVVEHENGVLWADEFSKILEKSHEKLEKMKVSKELALDMAKHLKEKYDEIQQSTQKLMEKLFKVQKNNERLKNELKEAQSKTEELEEFKTKQREQDIKTKEIMEENVRALTARTCDLEKKLLEKQREIEKIQTIRLVEIKNELKNKENQASDIQRLSKEKCELLERNDELALLLKNRHVEKQNLEQKICQLEEEVQMQKQYIKKKTKVLEETTTELELLRQSSSDLEEQVKILKRNTENLDETQKNLIKRTEEYEQQAKSNEEEMNKLKDENLTLKTELENQKDALLIKTKIIEDQQETIKHLKEKSEEAKTLLKEKESLERILNTEREEKLELKEAVERLKWRKEELKKKIKLLENDLHLAPQKIAGDLKKTQTVLFELENQVYSKQKEWELQFHSLTKEKEQACSIAEYATRKLIQTRSEFQKQSEAHKRLCRILTEKFTEQ